MATETTPIQDCFLVHEGGETFYLERRTAEQMSTGRLQQLKHEYGALAADLDDRGLCLDRAWATEAMIDDVLATRNAEAVQAG